MSVIVTVVCRHTLRKGDGGSKVAGLLSFPDEEGGSGQGQEGMVVWAADNSISMTLPSSKVGIGACRISHFTFRMHHMLVKQPGVLYGCY